MSAGQPLPRAVLLRLAADGELTEAQQGELGSLVDAESRAIETERALRQSVGRVMAAPVAAPLGLRERILDLAESGVETPALAAEPKAPVRAPASRAAAGDPDEVLDPIPMAPWMRPLAVAAAVLLMVAGGFMFLRGDGVDAGGVPAAGGAFAGATGGNGDAGSVQLVELRQFMSREHNRCERDPSAARKFAKAEISEIPERYRSLMGGDVSIDEIMKARLKLHGVGECHVPGEGSSIHLLLGAECSATLSLFIQRDMDNRLKLDEGVSYEFSPQSSSGGVSIVAWRRDGLTYFLVADPDACSRIREAMGHLELSTL